MILADKAIIISGVGPGMGRPLAIAVAREGAKVALAARSADFLAAVAKDIDAAGGTSIAIPTDVSDPAACERLAAATRDAFGRIDGLVNSAYAHPAWTDLENADLAEWRTAMDVICFGALHMVRAVLPAMKAQGGGAIVNVGSLTTRKPMPGEMGYAVAKGALTQITRHLAVELGRYNIRVNQALIGWMWGEPLKGYFETAARASGRTVEDLKAEVASRIPLGRVPNDADCAKAVLMLLSDYASEITGAQVDVNGGEWLAP